MYKQQDTLYNGSYQINKGTKMIRLVIGFLLVFGAVGGMDNGPEDAFVYQVIAAIIGLVLMYFGSNKVKENF